MDPPNFVAFLSLKLLFELSRKWEEEKAKLMWKGSLRRKKIVDFFLRPCERWNFPKNLFSRVSELFRFRSLEIFWKNPVFPNSQKFCEKSLEISLGQKQEFVLFQIFQKLQKNDIKIKFLFSWKTCSDSNSDWNIWVRVWYAGSYFFPLSMNETIIIVGALKGIQTVLDICFNILEWNHYSVLSRRHLTIPLSVSIFCNLVIIYFFKRPEFELMDISSLLLPQSSIHDVWIGGFHKFV